MSAADGESAPFQRVVFVTAAPSPPLSSPAALPVSPSRDPGLPAPSPPRALPAPGPPPSPAQRVPQAPGVAAPCGSCQLRPAEEPAFEGARRLGAGRAASLGGPARRAAAGVTGPGVSSLTAGSVGVCALACS